MGRALLTPQPHGFLQRGDRHRLQSGKGMARGYGNHVPFLEQLPMIDTLGKVVRSAKKRRMDATSEESVH